MNLHALRTVPRRSWWTLAIAILFVAAFAFDRHLGAVATMGILVYSVLVHGFQGLPARKGGKGNRRAINPSTGLSMTGIGTDAGGFFYGEDPFYRSGCD
jgi:hypothetical protein